ncbi:unnamed protein product [Polarella glacialis]|uniref:Uncharacterized protein n=1 Tax=Polarella glacialis TaxID=89957 RepID=A0A813IVP7_POLGL|nr:unnamed protein product [Polarella glacialis]
MAAHRQGIRRRPACVRNAPRSCSAVKQQQLQQQLQQQQRTKTTARRAWGDGRPHADWKEKAKHEILPDGPWSDMRRWCAEAVHSHTGKACRTCASKELHSSWGPQSQMVLKILASPYLYGSWEAAHAAGWRWYPRPRGRAHDHEWWPPQSMCSVYEATHGSLRLPLSTTDLRPILDETVDTARTLEEHATK